MPDIRLVPPSGSASKRLQHDFDQSLKLMDVLDRRAGIYPTSDTSEPATNPVPAMLEAPELTMQHKLDLVLWYLRDVHHHCYYTCTALWWPWNTKRMPLVEELAAAPGPDEGTATVSIADSSGAATDADAAVDDGEITEPQLSRSDEATKGLDLSLDQITDAEKAKTKGKPKRNRPDNPTSNSTHVLSDNWEVSCFAQPVYTRDVRHAPRCI